MDGTTPLHYFASVMTSDLDHRMVLQMLLSKGALLEARTSEGETPLHRAILKKNVEAATMLVEMGADINASTLYVAMRPTRNLF